MDQFLPKYQCGFREEFSTQDWLPAMFENWKRTINKGNIFGVLLRI